MGIQIFEKLMYGQTVLSGGRAYKVARHVWPSVELSDNVVSGGTVLSDSACGVWWGSVQGSYGGAYMAKCIELPNSAVGSTVYSCQMTLCLVAERRMV